MTTDEDLLYDLARHLRKHEVGCFDPDSDDQDRVESLITWFAESVDTLNVPRGGDEMTEPESAEVEATEAEAVEDAPETDAAADEASDNE